MVMVEVTEHAATSSISMSNLVGVSRIDEDHRF
jgi:hypothetical protein